MEENRSSWNSRFGYIMAAAGFPIGLGNVWRFPYLVGTNGGGAFVLIYLAICIVIGIPVILYGSCIRQKSYGKSDSRNEKINQKGSLWTSFG